MTITYDPDADAVSIRFNDARIQESDEITPNVVAEVGDDGEVVGIEILSASRLMTDPRTAVVKILAPEPESR